MKRAASELGTNRKGPVGGDQRVSPEQSHEPGQPRRGHDERLSLDLAGHPKGGKIDDGLVYHALDQSAVRVELRTFSEPPRQGAFELLLPLAKVMMERFESLVFRAQHHIQVRKQSGPRWQFDIPDYVVTNDARGCGAYDAALRRIDDVAAMDSDSRFG